MALPTVDQVLPEATKRVELYLAEKYEAAPLGTFAAWWALFVQNLPAIIATVLSLLGKVQAPEGAQVRLASNPVGPVLDAIRTNLSAFNFGLTNLERLIATLQSDIPKVIQIVQDVIADFQSA